MYTDDAAFAEGLTQRKRDILRRVIDHFVREIHPVSSRLVAEEVNLSSATVRNELAALEELGYLKQPHTSGGRVPTDLAYRFLVEELVQKLGATMEQRARVAGVYRQLSNETESLLEGTLDLLTQMTGFVAWVSVPGAPALSIRSVSFVEVEQEDLLIVLVADNGTMQSKLVHTGVPVAELSLGLLAERLNNYLRGRSLAEVDYAELRSVFLDFVDFPQELSRAIQDFFASMAAGKDRLLFNNALQLVLQPEFADTQSLTPVVAAVDDRERFIKMLRTQLNDRQLQTIIGTENLDPALHEVSLIFSKFTTADEDQGTLGVLGPTRQLYSRTLPWVRLIGEAVAQVYREMARRELEK